MFYSILYHHIPPPPALQPPTPPPSPHGLSYFITSPSHWAMLIGREYRNLTPSHVSPLSLRSPIPLIQKGQGKAWKRKVAHELCSIYLTSTSCSLSLSIGIVISFLGFIQILYYTVHTNILLAFKCFVEGFVIYQVGYSYKSNSFYNAAL